MEAVNELLMTRDEFEERHSRTGFHIARVGKIWEAVAEEQQAIINGKGYRYLDYQTWADYWDNEWQEPSGWSHATISNWIKARNIKQETYNALGADTQLRIATSPEHWRNLGSIADPEKRGEFLNRYEGEIKPALKAQGVSSQIFREGVNRFLDGDPTIGGMAESIARSAAKGNVPEHFHSRTISKDIRNLRTHIMGYSAEVMAHEMRRDASDSDVGKMVQTIGEVIDWLGEFQGGLNKGATTTELRQVRNDV